jgi:hypothetical protein
VTAPHVPGPNGTSPLPKPPEPSPLPAPRATPERLFQLLVTIANRLERLEGIAGRVDEDLRRLERRYDALEARVVGMHDHLALLNMLTGNLPSMGQLVLCMLGVAAASVALVVTGVLIARRYWGM